MNFAYTNTYEEVGDTTYITVTHKRGLKNTVTVVVDTEDIPRIKKTGVSLHNNNYIFLSLGHKYPLASLVMNHKPNTSTMVDHISGDTLDNRKCNLRVLTKSENSSYKTKAISNTGESGITLTGNSYLVCVTKRNTPEKKNVTKSFSIIRFGVLGAFNLAKEWRDQKRKEFKYFGY